MTEQLNPASRFRFVPLAEQQTHPTWEERRANPRVHSILFPVDLTDLELPELTAACQTCNQPYQRVTREFQIGWGHVEKLVCVIPNVPLLECNCRLFTNIEDVVVQRLEPAMQTIRRIYDSLNQEREEDLAALQTQLGAEDYAKVKDFIENRWAHPDSFTAARRRLKARKRADES